MAKTGSRQKAFVERMKAEGRKKVSFFIPGELVQRVKSVLGGETMQDWLLSAIDEKLKRVARKKSKESVAEPDSEAAGDGS